MMTSTEKLIKIIREGEPQWNVPVIETLSDEELIQELRRRGYTVKRANMWPVRDRNEPKE